MYLAYSSSRNMLQVGLGDIAGDDSSQGVVLHSGDSPKRSPGDEEAYLHVPTALSFMSANDAKNPIAFRFHLSKKAARRFFAVATFLHQYSARAAAQKKTNRRLWVTAVRISVVSLLLLPWVLSAPKHETVTQERKTDTDGPNSAARLTQILASSTVQRRLWRERNFGVTGWTIPLVGRKVVHLAPLGGDISSNDSSSRLCLLIDATSLHLVFANNTARTAKASLTCRGFSLYLIAQTAVAAVVERSSGETRQQTTARMKYRILPWDRAIAPTCETISSAVGQG